MNDGEEDPGRPPVPRRGGRGLRVTAGRTRAGGLSVRVRREERRERWDRSSSRCRAVVGVADPLGSAGQDDGGDEARVGWSRPRTDLWAGGGDELADFCLQ